MNQRPRTDLTRARPSARQLYQSPQVATILHAVMQSDSLDVFARTMRELLDATVPHHSLCVSFNNLEYFSPALIRDTKVSERCDLAYLTDRYVNYDPTPGFLREHHGITQSTLRDHLNFMPTGKRLLYCERFMRREGWDKYAEIYFWNDDSLAAVICVRRAPDQKDFSAEELRFLRDLRDMLAGCVQRLQRQHRQTMAANSLHKIVMDLPLPLILLDWSLQPFCFNLEARRLCLDWTGGESAARAMKSSIVPEVPAEILAACRERKNALMAGATPSTAARFEPRFLSIIHPSRPDLSAQIESINDTGKTGWPDFLVRLHKLAPPARLELENPPAAPNYNESRNGIRAEKSRNLSPLACLTRCEREIALLVREGLSNAEIAGRLHKSEATVKMQLHSAFRKLRLRRRTQLMALLD